MAKKVVKRVNWKRVSFLILGLLCLSFGIYFYIEEPIHNIYIINKGGNLSDEVILEESGLKGYPSFVMTSKGVIKKRLLRNDYIRSVKIVKTLNFKLYITIEEYRVLASYGDNMLILSNGKMTENVSGYTEYPRLINEVDSSVWDKFIRKFNMIDEDILFNISEIEYSPNEVDKERFILYMDDNNYVYVTLSKIKKLNRYFDICGQLGEASGIIYLDSGDYVEVKS